MTTLLLKNVKALFSSFDLIKKYNNDIKLSSSYISKVFIFTKDELANNELYYLSMLSHKLFSVKQGKARASSSELPRRPYLLCTVGSTAWATFLIGGSRCGRRNSFMKPK